MSDLYQRTLFSVMPKAGFIIERTLSAQKNDYYLSRERDAAIRTALFRAIKDNDDSGFSRRQILPFLEQVFREASTMGTELKEMSELSRWENNCGLYRASPSMVLFNTPETRAAKAWLPYEVAVAMIEQLGTQRRWTEELQRRVPWAKDVPPWHFLRFFLQMRLSRLSWLYQSARTNREPWEATIPPPAAPDNKLVELIDTFHEVHAGPVNEQIDRAIAMMDQLLTEEESAEFHKTLGHNQPNFFADVSARDQALMALDNAYARIFERSSEEEVSNLSEAVGKLALGVGGKVGGHVEMAAEPMEKTGGDVGMAVEHTGENLNIEIQQQQPFSADEDVEMAEA